ncbi:MFS transporter [Pelomonas cellulosilytica]|uniref:MFS transporter n=1 Tax=Pelomonas cellulosilytica TaxID=2906762 RepID=A0ABS8XSN1_9BURK|nr:MFS transporter [Pelomonas sp. P8]MCE4553831.1 MFS transporter [Pelomonas sp. P8]
MSTSPTRIRNPWSWVPSSYLAEGIPFALVIWVAGTMLKDLGHSDGEITMATASVGIAWSLKPFWAAFLDMFKTKKFFVLWMEVIMAVLLCGIAVALPLPNYFQITIAVLWVMAFASATQDICVDGIYITSLDEKGQAKYIGVQGVFWNVGRLFGTAAVVWLAGSLKEDHHLGATEAWQWAMGFSAATLALLAVYHRFMLPTGSVSERPESVGLAFRNFWEAIVDFFKKDAIWGMLLFVFLFRSSEGLLLIEGPLFLQASPDLGGVGLSLKDKGLIDGTIATAVSLSAGLLGGVFLSKFGLNRRTIVFMALCLNIPHVCFVVLSQLAGPGHTLSFWTVAALVTVEKFGYSFGFVANMLYMMQQISPGRFHMTHYAFANSIMNLTLVPTQYISGPLADHVGYKTYFIIVMVAAIPSVLGAVFAPFPRKVDGAAAVGTGRH